MRSGLKKVGIAGVAALSLIGATLTASSPAEARYYGHRWGGGGWGWGGPAFVGGLALGALAARPYYGYGYGYPGYAAYAYDDGCGVRRRVVGYTAYGRPIVRLVRVCY
jgi:hypothetical protein